MNSTGIEWTHIFGPRSGRTWNPIVGCTNGCEYCYARRQARRSMHKCADCGTFTPHLHEERLVQPLKRRKPAGIFLGSMCDLWDPNVPQDWRDRIWEVVEACPQHVFWVLTQQPDKIDRFATPKVPHLWLGVTCQDEESFPKRSRRLSFAVLAGTNTFISFEPLHGPIDFLNDSWGDYRLMDWFVVGAETGNRKGKVVPEAKWVTDIVDRAEAYGTALFLKDNLVPVMGEGYVKSHQDWPEAMTAPHTH